MRIRVATLALALAIPAGTAAQVQSSAPAPAQRHTFLPQHKTRLNVDFGAKKALKNLPQWPIRCDSVRKHPPHELVRGAGGWIELPIYGGRHRVTAPASPCPVR